MKESLRENTSNLFPLSHKRTAVDNYIHFETELGQCQPEAFIAAGDEDMLLHDALFFSCIIDKTDKIYATFCYNGINGVL